jgi:transposase
MSLCAKVQVDLPDEGITIRRSGKYNTVYKVMSSFRNSKGQPTSERVSIGRLDCASGRLIPNDNYWRHYGDKAIEVLPDFDSVRSIGAVFLFGSILRSLGIASILEGCLGKERSVAALTASLYMACCSNVFEYVLDFCEGHTLHEQPLSSQSSSALFASITYDERMAFFKRWVAAQADESYLAYDVTSFSSWAEGIADTEWGHNRDGERLPQINLGCYLSERSALPVFYVTYPGSIVDKSHLPYMMAYNSELDISGVGFVMDRGFCSTANVKYMASKGLDFILGAEIRHKATREAVGKVRDGIVSMRNRTGAGVYALSVHGTFYGALSTMHVYHDPSLAERQRRDLFRTVESFEETLCQLGQLTEREAKRYGAYFAIVRAGDGTFTFERDYGKIDAAALNAGFFCLLTNTDKDSSEVLAIYRRKDLIEKGFDDLKNHIDMRRMRTHNAATTDGKMFLAFVALIAASEMQAKLGKMMRERSWSKDAVIRELDKIKVITAADNRRLMSPVTKTQRLIFEAFGLSEDDLKAYVLGSKPGASVCA